MHIAKTQIPANLEAPGAIARMANGFGDAKGYSSMNGEFFSLAAGTDIAPLLTGLKDDLCQAPHWGYLAEGAVTVTYRDGTRELISRGDLFYWPPGHTVSVQEDAELIMFSPQHEHGEVLAHMKSKMG